MKLVHFDNYRLGLLTGADDDQVIDITDLVGTGDERPQERLATLIERWDEVAPALAVAAKEHASTPLSGVRLRPSVPKPGQLVCAAVNYLEPAHPEPGPFNAFLKSPLSIIGYGDTVELPDTPASVFHFEPELALIIGKYATHLTPETALEYVFGYTPFIDVSARGLPGGFFLGKSWHTFAPLGPAIVTADEIADPNALTVAFAVNGTTRQTYSTGDMARHVPQLLAEITKVIALEPGDVVATGVHHDALSPIGGGDRVRVTIAGVGPALDVLVHDASGRSWS